MSHCSTRNDPTQRSPRMRRGIIFAAMILSTAFACLALADGNSTGSISVAAPQNGYHFAGTADHVRIVSVARDARERDKISVTLVIDPGYHINANPASYKSLIPTTLTFDGYELRRVIYPKPYQFKPKFVDEALDVYQGTELIIAFFPSGSLKPDSRLHGILLAQACTDEICLPPAEIVFSE